MSEEVEGKRGFWKRHEPGILLALLGLYVLALLVATVNELFGLGWF